LMVIGQTLINHRRPTPDMVGGCLQRRQKPNSCRNDHKVGADVFGPRARACKAIAISAEPGQGVTAAALAVGDSRLRAGLSWE
jgi:hypothetical protein